MADRPNPFGPDLGYDPAKPPEKKKLLNTRVELPADAARLQVSSYSCTPLRGSMMACCLKFRYFLFGICTARVVGGLLNSCVRFICPCLCCWMVVVVSTLSGSSHGGWLAKRRGCTALRLLTAGTVDGWLKSWMNIGLLFFLFCGCGCGCSRCHLDIEW